MNYSECQGQPEKKKQQNVVEKMQKLRVVSKHPVNIRAYPNRESDSKFLVWDGHILTKISEKDGWIKVRSKHGDLGFIMSDLVEEVVNG